MVSMGPSVPMSAVRAAPIRRMAAEVMNTGSTVENTAMPTACRYTGAGCASACEAAVVALSSRPHVRVVGQATAGVATGNESDVDVAECIDYLAEDPETRVICAALEACRDGRQPLDLLCVEGSLLRGPNGTGRFHLLAGTGVPMIGWVRELAAVATHVVAVGSCAAWGGSGSVRSCRRAPSTPTARCAPAS